MISPPALGTTENVRRVDGDDDGGNGDERGDRGGNGHGRDEDHGRGSRDHGRDERDRD